MATKKPAQEKIKQQKAVNDANGKYQQSIKQGREINAKKSAEMKKGKK